MNNFIQFLLRHKASSILILFYAVGAGLFAIPTTRELFVAITPWSLLGVIALVFAQHKAWDVKTVLCFLSIILFSFLLESFGVATGEIFGRYEYDRGMGIQILDTPLLIGLNWLFLVYASHDIARSMSPNKLLVVLIGALLMVAFDSIMEVAAPAMCLWQFETSYPPFENFMSWFVAALVFHSVFSIFNIRVTNTVAKHLFWIQFVFFILISLVSLAQ